MQDLAVRRLSERRALFSPVMNASTAIFVLVEEIEHDSVPAPESMTGLVVLWVRDPDPLVLPLDVLSGTARGSSGRRGPFIRLHNSAPRFAKRS